VAASIQEDVLSLLSAAVGAVIPLRVAKDSERCFSLDGVSGLTSTRRHGRVNPQAEKALVMNREEF
jgi:hypothetical protein